MFNKRLIFSFFGFASLITTTIFFNLGENKEITKNENFEAVELVKEEKEEHQSELERIKSEAARAFKKMNDYSFKMFGPCGIGTGWILDYEIPQGNHYPTKWYIATNAHVISSFRFLDNPYHQELPISSESTKALRSRWRNIGFSHLNLATKTTCDAVKDYGYFDMNLSRAENGKELQNNLGAIHNKKMKEPNLFYVPINFLEKDESMGIEDNNYRDFAVIEVEFTDENYAREATGNFYNKYPPKSSEAINIFGSSLEEKSSWDEIENTSDNFYSLAYPFKKGDAFSFTTNFDETTGLSSRLSKDKYRISNGKPVRGYVDSVNLESKFPSLKTKWNGKTLNSIGYFYLLENFAMPGGSSGGLYIDKDGNILGIKRIAEWEALNQSWIVPLRSREVIKDGVIKSPAYDLILGSGPKQKTSYKAQVEKYNKDTFLRRNGWKHSF